MGYIVDISKDAKEDILSFQKAGNKIALAKIDKILEELAEHPEIGIGKPEKMKYKEKNRWSRRIDKKNRMTYEIENDIVTVYVISVMGHYDDK